MMFNVGNLADCRRCRRRIRLAEDPFYFARWVPEGFEPWPLDCPERRGENCTPYPPETW